MTMSRKLVLVMVALFILIITMKDIYTGGRLNFKTNVYGEIYAATTRVTVLDNGATKYFDITIE